MDDHDYPPEVQIDYFRCVEKPHTALTNFDRKPPSSSAPLLAVSSRFGYLLHAVRSAVHIYSLPNLRYESASHPANHADCISVDLVSHGVSAILGISLLRDDTEVLIHAEGDRGGVFVVSLPALVNGDMAWIAGVKLDKGIVIREIAAAADSMVAMVEEGGSVSLCELQPGKEVDAAYIQGLGEAGALCVGISPGGELVAVGVECGSLFLYDVASLERKGEIVVVESGWVPFAISFITEEDMLVGYVRDSMYYYIVWTLTEDNAREGALLANTRSMLGELCYPALSLPPSEDEGELQDKSPQNDSLTPMVFCCPIKGWPICVVSSSCSSDIEVIARKEEGDGWEIWKFDEGKSAVLPVGEADNDSKPLGIGLDLTDTEQIDAMDPSAPNINPMPRLIALTTEGELVPFVLIDDRKGASCNAVRKIQSLPPPLSFPRPAGDINSQKNAPTEVDSNTNADNKTATIDVSTNFMRNSGSIQNEESQTFPVFGFKAENLSSFNQLTRQPGFAGGDAFGTHMTNPGGVIQEVPSFSLEPRVRKQWSDSSSTADESGGDVRGTDEDESKLTSSATTTGEEDGTERSSIKSAQAELSFPQDELAFSETEKFLSKFEFVDISDEHRRNKGAKSYPSVPRPPGSRTRVTKPPRGSEMSSTSSLAPISLPAYPLQPSFEEVSAAANTGKPEDLIRSVLLEFKQELDYNRQAQHVMTTRTRAVVQAIMPLVNAVKDDLGGILQDIREYFREETALRRVVVDSLAEITARSKEFETTCLEFRIREEEGFSRDLQPEDKLIDEEISKKELAVMKSLAEIENRLRTERMSRDRPRSQVERIQHIYSSLGLQGIRIRRVCGILAVLAARVNELESSGRRSDLGLSVARLEKLARSENPSTVKGNSGSLAPSPFKPDPGIRARTPGSHSELNKTRTVPDYSEGKFGASKGVLSVLRRIAMRGGRANIEANSSKTLFERNGYLERFDPHRSGAGNKHRGNHVQHGKEEENNDSKAMTSTTQFAVFDTATSLQTSAYNHSTQLQESSTTFVTGELTKLGVDSVASGTGQISSGLSQTHDKTSDAWTSSAVFPFTNKRGSPTVNSATRTVAIEPNGFERDTTSRLSDVNNEPLKPKVEVLGSFGTARSCSPDKLKDETNRATLTAQSDSTGLFASPKHQSSHLKSQAPPKPKTHQAYDQTESLPSLNAEITTRTGKGVKDCEPVIGLTATLPSDDFAPSAPLPPDELEAKSFHAPLPPDDDVKNSLRTSLFRKRREETYLNANVPPHSTNIDRAGDIANPTDLRSRSPAAGLPDESSASEALSHSNRGSPSMGGGFAALPPDDVDGKDLFTSSSQLSSIQEKHETPLEGARREGESISATDRKSSILQRDSQALISRGGDGIHSKVDTNVFGQDSSEKRTPAVGKLGGVQTFGGSDAKTVTPYISSTSSSVLGGQSQGGIRGNATEHDVFISDEPDAARKSGDRETFGMDTSMVQPEVGKGFRSMAVSLSSSGQADSMGAFGSAQSQSLTHSGFGQIATRTAPLTSSVSVPSRQADQSGPGIFGTGDSNSGRGFGFHETSSSTSALSSSGEGFGANFGATSQFGQHPAMRGSNTFGASTPSNGSAQFGVNSTFGGNNIFGGSQFGAGFGETSQIGAGSPFNTVGGGGLSGFGSSAPTFGKGMSAVTFGDVSSFGAGQSGQGSFGGSNSFGSANASPFTTVTGGGFSGQSGGGSGFAALATPQGFGGSGGSGFGNAAVPVFGNDNRPPAFTSAAFSERRA
eukprot:GFKZ01001587.1.p1 GENE.GFKZ01001587.1~~GFKZ01001587.1.p1  ORF type:complete len:1760 (-),score=194.43 GFKZ01001587.1:477-5756(-)